MKYKALIHPEAEADIRESYEWGVEYWGNAATDKWIREMHSAIFGRLTFSPKRCAIAPESAATDKEVRQLLIGRYRVLFEIGVQNVIVLHVAGPFVKE